MEKSKGKGIRNYLVKVLNGMALGLFSSLIIGLIFKQIGRLLNIEILIRVGQLAQYMMSASIGAGVAYSVGASPLGIMSAVAAGVMGGGSITMSPEGLGIITPGEPAGAFISALIAAEVAKLVQGKTKLDIILVPATTLIVGGVVGSYISPIISSMMNAIGEVINFATIQQPIIMGIIISVIMGILLTMPVSSAAVGISLGLSGLSAGAAIIGCASHMIGFAVMSFKENGFGGLIAQGLGTSMLQIPNIVKNPKVIIPPIITSAILGPIGTTIFKMEGNSAGSGMGTSGLVGQIATIEVMGIESIYKIAIMHFILPAILTVIGANFMRKKGWIKENDLKLSDI